jgi:hypothetical protein
VYSIHTKRCGRRTNIVIEEREVSLFEKEGPGEISKPMFR